MALAQTRPIYPTSLWDLFQSTWSRFHGSRLQILRYGLSNYSHMFYSCSSQNVINVESIEEKSKRTFGSSRETVKFQSLDQKPMQNSWIQKWDGTHHQNFQRRPQTVIDYKEAVVSSEEDSGGRTEDFGSDWDGERIDKVEKIVEKLKRFGYVDEVSEKNERRPERGTVEDIFYVEPGTLPNSRGGFSDDSPFGVEERDGDDGDVRFPWEKLSLEKEAHTSIKQRRSKSSLAELTLPHPELRRLRNLAIGMKERTKIGNAGVVHEIVDIIQEKWKKAEVVKLKCEGNSSLNMKRTHEILERKTGGLVIWRSGSSVLLYRGISYDLPSAQSMRPTNEIAHKSGIDKATEIPQENGSNNDMKLVNLTEVKKDSKSREIKDEHEVDKLLEDLGPRFTDWPGCDPLPVDADLLPGVVPGYKLPFRILPYGVGYTLGNKEMTSLRRLARILPPHFALGRSRQHQGLAVAMVKLWERSYVAKIALKRGAQLTSSERMAKEIKNLTGGTIVSRNKDFIVFYRGKDFLSPSVTEPLLERERLAKVLQEEEEQVRLRSSSSVISNIETSEDIGIAGTLGETRESDAHWGKKLENEDGDKMMRATDVARHAALVRKLERNLEFVRNIALSLEAESGGILVSVDKVSKGYAMVVFRGREYQRPPLLRLKNLLTKRGFSKIFRAS